MSLPRTLPLALLAALAAPAAHAEFEIGEFGGTSVSFEGLLQADYDHYNSDVADLDGDPGDGRNSDQELRRAELVLKGKGPGGFDWVVGYDAKADKWLDVNGRLRFGADRTQFLQVGQYKQPNSLEELSSTKNNDFIAKAMTTNTFGVSRRLGAAYGIAGDDWTATASWFGRELTSGQAEGSGYGVRGTWAPLNDDGRIVHLGLSYVDFDTPDDGARLRTRPNADLAGVRLVDTGTLLDADRQSVLGVEAMWINGPVKLQGEYMRAGIDRIGTATQTSGDFSGHGWYVSGLWNVAGETWGYKGGVPSTPKAGGGNRGLWQVGLRYDRVDLDDGRLSAPAPGEMPVPEGVLGGEMDAWTVGVNWYWRDHVKLALNYVDVSSTRYNGAAGAFVDDEPSIVEARLQLHW
ncbi:OprO/OprP family phosphate-selective porin [Luteimonas suaedae]|uniref:OprO/OprP family phosphate-selective porin n=1 Tax=Luteimonas suaedae TaxID=2605430 RepID=UPI0011EBE6B8|nr:OprO/OprP family phosphate-selective porin [Luteimonas suaedae]